LFWVYQWKNLENLSIFRKVIDMSSVSCFFDSQCSPGRKTDSCGRVQSVNWKKWDKDCSPQKVHTWPCDASAHHHILCNHGLNTRRYWGYCRLNMCWLWILAILSTQEQAKATLNNIPVTVIPFVQSLQHETKKQTMHSGALTWQSLGVFLCQCSTVQPFVTSSRHNVTSTLNSFSQSEISTLTSFSQSEISTLTSFSQSGISTWTCFSQSEISTLTCDVLT